ncbi:MAG: diaminopimelate decarboxylase [Ignavibacteriae bacterium]|nr:MAG: diaminopimelate decarboxylase [Ignavibacteriota bacterium]
MEKLNFERPIIRKINTGISNKFGMKTEFEPIKHIDNVGVKGLAAEYGSPVFVLSEKTMRRTFNDAKRAFDTRYPKVQFSWSYKTNYLNAVCNVFHSEGSWAEVVSRFEYDKAIANGVPGNKIIFNGPDKTDDDLNTAIKNDSFIHIDHFDELYKLIELAPKHHKKPKVAIRVNMDTGIYPMWDRFGFNYENGEAWEAISKIIISNKLEFTGLHTHIGTFILSASAYAIAASKLAELAVRIKLKFHKDISYIDMGGGFASSNTLKGSYLMGIDTSPSFDDYAEAITTALINSDIDPDNMPLLILETGRALIDDAGSLIGSVVANKKLSDGRKATIMDFGVNLLFTSFWYDHKITPAQDFSHHSETTTLYGPLCMNIDQIRESISLPPLKRGDLVVVSKVGAYNMTQWMQFIMMRPKVVLIDKKGEVHIIRHNETREFVESLEEVPLHLKKAKDVNGNKHKHNGKPVEIDSKN